MIIPNIEMQKTKVRLFGNNKTPSKTNGVLGIRKKPLNNEIKMYIIKSSVLLLPKKFLRFEASKNAGLIRNISIKKITQTAHKIYIDFLNRFKIKFALLTLMNIK